MEVEFAEEAFTDFGSDPYFPYPRTGLCYVEGSDSQQLRDNVRRHVPRCSGVYGMLDALGRLIYVGKSKMLRNRLLSYFMPNNEEDKAGRIIGASTAVVWEPQPSEFAALLREQYLIRHFQPRFNVQGMPKRHQPIFVCLGNPPAEQLFTSRKFEPSAMAQIGPVFGAKRAGRAVEVLNRNFLLRDCSSKQSCSFTNQLQLFDIELRPGCIRLEIQSCLGPCISACSQAVYEKQVGLARDFLQGNDDSPVDQIDAMMKSAAADSHFERAAVLREDWRAVRWLSRKAGEIKRARENYTFVYPVQGTDCGRFAGQPSKNFDIWYLVRRGVLEGAIAAPITEPEKRRVRRMLSTWLDDDDQVGGEHAPRPETLALITSWFRNNRSELKNAFVPGAQRAPAARKQNPQKGGKKATNSAAVRNASNTPAVKV